MEQIIEILKLAWYGHDIEGLIKLEPIIAAAAIGGGISLLSGLFGSSSANKRARRAQSEARRRERELDILERNRQAIINPYDQISNLSDTAIDLSDQMTNPFANLGVATKAAEIQVKTMGVHQNTEHMIFPRTQVQKLVKEEQGFDGGATPLSEATFQMWMRKLDRFNPGYDK